jgi:uncharacterized protein (TIGR03437 family)
VAFDAGGNLYIADMGNHRIRRVDTSGTITTVAGNGAPGRGADDVPATSSSLNFPSGVAVDAAGNLYIDDWQNYLIRKVTFSAQPAINPGGVVNGASFAPAPSPVAPGSIISLFGLNLAFAESTASEIPLPTELGGASVKVNGSAIPLYFVSPTQINAQLPFEIVPGTATAVVSNAAGDSPPVTFNVAASAVGVFQFAGTNRAIALNQEGDLNGPDHPEARGKVIQVFATGQGLVSPAVATGQAALSDPLSRVTSPMTATIGGVPADIQFFGLAPGFVGLAQVNIQIPDNVTTGDQVGMFISVNGQAGNTATIAVK